MFEQYPKSFGSYTLLEKIGQGGMAEIFRAENTGPQGFAKEVAIKRILASLASNEDFITQFLDEARIVGNLSHPNIVQIYDVGQVDDAYYIAMEYVDGKHLGQVIQRAVETMNQVPVRESIAIINEVCKALAFAHSAVDSMGHPLDIIHRDVSPQNILVGYNGAVKLTDFGIAKAANKLFQTTAGVIKGKFSYLAPEQLIGKGASTASDIFSLGVALWEMISGRRLFQGESDIRTIQMVQACQVPPLSQFRSDVPLELEQVLAYMLAPQPEYRYQNAYDLVNMFSHLLHQYGISEHLHLIANFMGSLYPEAFANTGAAPTRASIPAISDAQAAAYYTPAPPEDFVDAPTAAISDSPLYRANSQEDVTSPLEQDNLSLDSPTMPLDAQKVQDFFATQQMMPVMVPSVQLPSVSLPPPISFPSALSDEISETLGDKPTSALPIQEEAENSPSTDPTLVPLRTSRWKGIVWTCVLLVFLGGGVAFAYLYYQQHILHPVDAEPLSSQPATIQVSISPPEAHVTLNGQPIQGREKRTQTGLISGLKYSVRASLKGYKTITQQIELTDGQTYQLKLTLQPETVPVSQDPKN